MYPASVDPRQENHSQSVHLHMHHFCPCLNMVYQYCPPTYRPSLVPYPQSRPYNLHHYQYTQYNMLPYNGPATAAAHAAAAAAAASVVPQHVPAVPSGPQVHSQAATHFSEVVFGPAGPPAQGNGIVGAAGGARDRRNMERSSDEALGDMPSTSGVAEKKLGAIDVDFLPIAPIPDVTVGSAAAAAVIQPTDIQEVIIENNVSTTTTATTATITTTTTPVTDTFIKFLEDSCLRAEHIAYRNRNRPCFRNIQNLCIRTRNEILKPCTTISNIHSQGIPWATKDFIYAFIRLINCWHILKGYLEKDGSLGKIEKELTTEFKACYYKWEKDSMELAEELRRIFCNLDANISNPTAAGAGNGGNPNFDITVPLGHVPTRPQNGAKRCEQPCPAMAGLVTKEATVLEARKGGLATASTTVVAAVGSESVVHFDSSESSLKEEDSIYMKPGSYSVPRKNESSNESPRSFEFLETAQNTHKRYKDKQESVEKMWQNAQTAAPSLISRMVPSGLNFPLQKVYEDQKDEELLFGTAVQTWVNTGLYPSTTEDVRDKDFHQNNPQSSFDSSKPITVLQRSKNGPFEPVAEKGCMEPSNYFHSDNYALLRNSIKDGFQKQQEQKKVVTQGVSCAAVGGKVEVTSRMFRKQQVEVKSVKREVGRLVEDPVGIGVAQGQNGFSKDAAIKFREILTEMKTTEFSVHLDHRTQMAKDDEDKELKFPTTLSTISKKFEENTYHNIDEIVHDFRYLTLHAKLLFKDEDVIMTTLTKFVQKFERAISTAFPEIEFNHLSGERCENVISAHQNKKTRNDGDGDH